MAERNAFNHIFVTEFSSKTPHKLIIFYFDFFLFFCGFFSFNSANQARSFCSLKAWLETCFHCFVLCFFNILFDFFLLCFVYFHFFTVKFFFSIGKASHKVPPSLGSDTWDTS